ncbi:SusD family protein [Mucilaginibacter pineti]|uniref:SusD family protein n=1 Tax=Mucilaginibacter pineti TaxID=1391627 RepID=A0A1G7ET18_9SPHI|nr:RagB/SusD family nutrient uptake outer membrane protein [Mucilaginibacter pineti]SDE66830.1 SusD family protein [Mucilaginibacter pineti]
MTSKNIILNLIALALINTQVACKKQLEVNVPSFASTTEKSFETDSKAAAVMAGIYSDLSNSSAFAVSIAAGLSADELMPFKTPGVATINLYRNNLNGLNSETVGIDFWAPFYQVIYSCNTAISGLGKSITLSPEIRKRFLAEAKFTRAFAYFYLVNLYGDVPLITETDYEKNRLMTRTPRESVYQLIISDLNEAEAGLGEAYMDGTLKQPSNERTRPVKWAAAALLSRVYLYRANYAEAEVEAGKVIERTGLYSFAGMADAFLKNNSEAILQLQPVGFGQNTKDAQWLVIPPGGDVQPFTLGTSLNEGLIKEFEPGDLRRTSWIDSITLGSVKSFYSFKYKVYQGYSPELTEYTTLIRLPEMYLIRAEARIQLGRIGEGIADLNLIRQRARGPQTAQVLDPLPALSADLSKDAALAACMHERRVELFTEWGHRWLDLKRTGKVDQVMGIETPKKGGVWKSTAQYYPLINSELNLSPNVKQTPGY